MGTDAATKTAAQFTPGPWRLGEEDLRGGKFFSVYRSPKLEPIDLHEDDNGAADCRLIAASPDLLAALKDVLRIAKGATLGLGDASKARRIAAAEAAIAAAEGSAP